MESRSGTRFGRRLRELRQSRGLTLEELAEASGVSGRAIGDMERGRSLRPRRGTIAALAQGLGLDESIHADLLAIARASRPVAGPSDSVVPPHQVPRGVRDFVGRRAELDLLRDVAQRHLADTDAPDRGRYAVAPPVAVVFGSPGSGKTTLAIRLAEECGTSFTDGAFLVDMRGLDAHPLSVDDAVVRLLGAWGVGDLDVAQLNSEERLARYHAMAADLRAVVILDNAAGEAQVRPLLPRTGGVLMVVTSRRTLAGLEGVQRVELGALSEPESASLLRAVVGAGRVDAEPEAARSVTELCGHLPLALRVAANWAATRSNWSLHRLATRLNDENRRLDLLSAGDLRVNSAFSLSYSRLAAGAARMFRLLSLVPGGDFGVPLAAVLADTTIPEAEDVLEELLEAGLLATHHEDRYRLHDLLCLYARSRHQVEDSPQRSAADAARLRAWLLDTAVLAGRWYEPGYGAPAPDPLRLVALDSRRQAFQWIKAESDNWSAAFHAAAAEGEHAQVVEVAEAMHWFSDNWVSSGLWVDLYERAAEASASLGDPVLEATHLNYLAWAYWACDRRHDDAVRAAERALVLAGTAGDVIQEAWAHTYLGSLLSRAGDPSRAADSARRAMDLFAKADEINGYLQACNVAIDSLASADRTDEAIETYGEVMAVLADARNIDRIPSNVRDVTALIAAYHVSFAYLAREDWHDVVDVLRPIGGRFEALGWDKQEGKVHLYLARALTGLGELAAATAELEHVLVLEGRVPPELVEEARSRLGAPAEERSSSIGTDPAS
ncbi:helix-turn-helix domain-containing protein [Streptomyces sp. NPDC051362]|uniref:helix-turn-helix domain-containing protein n=1 Tax=Streptomyces sp. NPDC051362 TaxID=3365651 RepID=UPI00378F394B